jgi:hypothetical protein
MRVIRAEDPPEYGVGLGSILVSLLEPAPGTAVAFNRWYERDHFFAGCMTGEHFFAGRRFVATRELKDLRYPASSATVADTSSGSYLALYWMEQGHHEAAERWAVDRVLWLTENGRMEPTRAAVHANFYRHKFAVCREADGIPPEVALEHNFPGVALVLSERPEGVGEAKRDAWLRDEYLPKALPGSAAALCLTLQPLPLPEESPVYYPPPEGFDRRSLEVYFLDEDPRACWQGLFADMGQAHEAAGMGPLHFVGGFLPTVPGTDRYADEV